MRFRDCCVGNRRDRGFRPIGCPMQFEGKILGCGSRSNRYLWRTWLCDRRALCSELGGFHNSLQVAGLRQKRDYPADISSKLKGSTNKFWRLAGNGLRIRNKTWAEGWELNALLSTTPSRKNTKVRGQLG